MILLFLHKSRKGKLHLFYSVVLIQDETDDRWNVFPVIVQDFLVEFVSKFHSNFRAKSDFRLNTLYEFLITRKEGVQYTCNSNDAGFHGLIVRFSFFILSCVDEEEVTEDFPLFRVFNCILKPQITLAVIVGFFEFFFSHLNDPLLKVVCYRVFVFKHQHFTEFFYGIKESLVFPVLVLAAELVESLRICTFQADGDCQIVGCEIRS